MQPYQQSQLLVRQRVARRHPWLHPLRLPDMGGGTRRLLHHDVLLLPLLPLLPVVPLWDDLDNNTMGFATPAELAPWLESALVPVVSPLGG